MNGVNMPKFSRTRRTVRLASPRIESRLVVEANSNSLDDLGAAGLDAAVVLVGNRQGRQLDRGGVGDVGDRGLDRNAILASFSFQAFLDFFMIPRTVFWLIRAATG